MNRRDFLHPRTLLGPAGQMLGAAEEIRALVCVPPDASDQDAVLLRFARRAMATTFEVMLPFTAPQDAADAALDLIDSLESQLTVYRDDSEVSRLNQRAPHEPVIVERGLFDLLALSQNIHQKTDGAFDISVGALIKAWGFFRRAGRVPDAAELQSVRGKIGLRHVALDAENTSVYFRRPGLELNLGSIGKGYAVDRAARLLRDEYQCRSALVHGGHSSVFALGDEPGKTNGWQVGVLDPRDRTKRLVILRLKDRGLGTSAATYQHLEYQGRKLPHLLDPRTCWPAEGMLLASATAPTAAEADALATAFFILGMEKTRAYCDLHPEIGAVLLPEKATTPVVLGRACAEVV